ncbi:DUF2637 domain-containing protein [Micromonospora sp. CA-248260]|uniref:DUF2637 domain-containing protein n=1 Tax=Micromonospora sp. CA-248260 TaxID=3239962 RepID=UPI003D907FEF
MNTPTRKAARWNARRVASIICTVIVSLVAAVGSYDHMRELALSAGQSPFLATLLPFSVDGMILVATLALGDGRHKKGSAWAAFLIGVLASLAANVIVADADLISRVVSAWPAVALLLTVEVLARAGKSLPIADSILMPIADPLSLADPVIPAPQPMLIADFSMPIPCPSEPVQPAWWNLVPVGVNTLPIVPRKPVADRNGKPRIRKHVVPAHTEKRAESAKPDVAEIVARADALKSELGTWKAVADALGIAPRTLQNYRNSQKAVMA